ncbi:hypothetical protein ACQPXS_21535 [Streptomyces sp. CA-142005]|uniref:hypothetical protein n=1 Tax=Streptomyces sp. CA-142005 TaxID=3240052 RepID=UPI003D8F0CB8
MMKKQYPPTQAIPIRFFVAAVSASSIADRVLGVISSAGRDDTWSPNSSAGTAPLLGRGRPEPARCSGH